MLKLYHGSTSTCSKRVRITLAAKGLEWQSVHINLAKRENLYPDYLKLNPNGVVPTLDHDGRILCESNVIIEYLDETFPVIPLRPEDFYERAKMRIWMDRFEHQLHANINTVSWIRQGRYKRFEGMSKEELQAVLDSQANEASRAKLKRRLEHGVSDEEVEFAEGRIAEVLDDMEVALKNRPWLCGNALSLADISAAPFIERFESNKMERLVDWTRRPRIGDWWERMKAQEAFKIGFSFQPPAG